MLGVAGRVGDDDAIARVDHLGGDRLAKPAHPAGDQRDAPACAAVACCHVSSPWRSVTSCPARVCVGPPHNRIMRACLDGAFLGKPLTRRCFDRRLEARAGPAFAPMLWPVSRRLISTAGKRRGKASLTASAAVVACTLAGGAPEARAQSADPDTGTRLAPVVVTATRTQAAPFDVPASIDRIGGETIRDARMQVNISENLGGVPGLLARDRQNYAQDVQISVRGFGARSTFGIRGVRLYVDGIPATLPDGQGQITNVDLGSADRIEVLRGPFSALYGNSSGGVIQVFTEDGSGPPTFGVGRRRRQLRHPARRRQGERRGRRASATSSAGATSSTDGYRDHSAAERDIGNVKLTWRPTTAASGRSIVNSVAPAQGPGPARPDAGRVRCRSAQRRSGGDPVRHPQDGRPDPGRR